MEPSVSSPFFVLNNFVISHELLKSKYCVVFK